MNNSTEFSSFLKEAKKSINNVQTYKESFHLVIGNESADLDSLVSALVYAFYLSKLPKQPPCESIQYIPVVSVHQDDLPLRTEIIALLKKVEIPVEHLVYLNDLNFESISPSSVKRVTLVDFNNRAKHLNGIADKVCQIIDHHEDSDEYLIPNKNIKTVGSCATLVTEEIYYSKNSVLPLFPVSEMLMSAILIDTYNLDLHSGRTTELDIFLGEILTSYTSEDPDQLFAYLQEAKMDISTMNTYDILRKDYKPVPSSLATVMGISSATNPSSLVLSRGDFIEATTRYMSKVQLDVLVIMFLSFKDGSTSPFREISIVAKDTKSLQDVAGYLLSYKKDLELSEKFDYPDYLKGYVKLYDQSPKLSRKFVLPLLKKFHIVSSI